MNRNSILQVAIVSFLILIMAILAVGLSPIWVIVGMINPNIFSPLSRLIMQRMTRQAVKSMMSGGN